MTDRVVLKFSITGEIEVVGDKAVPMPQAIAAYEQAVKGLSEVCTPTQVLRMKKDKPA